MNEELWKICGIALVCAITALLLGRYGGEFVGPIRIAGGVLIFGVLLLGVSETLASIRALFEGRHVDRYIDLMFRALGLCFLSTVCSNLCRDCGETAVAGGVEIAGKLAIVVLCLPLVEEMMQIASELLQMGS